MEWRDVVELIDDLISFYDEKYEEGPIDHQDIWKAAKEKALKKREAILAKIQPEQVQEVDYSASCEHVHPGQPCGEWVRSQVYSSPSCKKSRKV